MAKGATKQLAVWVVRRLREAGFEALLAGGCVRDMLLGIRPADYDVATSATPKQIRRLFGHVLMVGAQFGVAMVIRGNRMIEVATFRSDLSYSDGRRPDKIVFSDPRADAQRRDFTINGMFLDPLDDGARVIDYVGGQKDLRLRLVRAIGQPDQRFSEDYLRMLRAVRFAARLDFTIEPATAAAIGRYCGNIHKVSGERIREELEKILTGHALVGMRMSHDLGLIEPIFGPALTDQATWQAATARLKMLGERLSFSTALAAMLADQPPEEVSGLMRRWGASNQLREEVLWLTEHAHLWPTAAQLPLADLKMIMARRCWPALRQIWRAEERVATGRLGAARKLARRTRAIDPAQVNPAPFITGADLKAMGLAEGPQLGHIIRTVRREQLNERITTRQRALEMARQMIEGKEL